jgi:hypothetical protein
MKQFAGLYLEELFILSCTTFRCTAFYIESGDTLYVRVEYASQQLTDCRLTTEG